MSNSPPLPPTSPTPSSPKGLNNGKGSPIPRRQSLTFESQATLPRLPIPTLEETLEKLPKVLEALQTPEQQLETKEIIAEFKNGPGPKLQKLLLAYDKEGEENKTLGSYVESFWNDSYLSPLGSVVLNLNPFFVLEEGPDPKTAKDQIKRAAALCFASVKLASLLKNHTLRPDVFKGKPLCMDQFKVLFGSCRVPNRDNQDEVEVYEDSTHVAVLCHNEIYYFQALWPDGTVAVNEADIVDILEAINKNAGEVHLKESSKHAVGVLTSLPRKEWAAARDELCQFSPKNSVALGTIDSALFVLVLDDYCPSDANETAANMLHGTYKMDPNFNQIGTCCNRWYDKLQVIVCANGTAGVNFEHSSIDGHTALRFVSDIMAETIVVFAQSITKLIHGIGHLPHVIDAEVKRAALTLDENGAPWLDVFPKRVSFSFPPRVLDKIYYAETALGDEIVASDTVVLEFAKYGKSLIVSNKLSPDSFVQMTMILAYYRLYGKVVCTYEPVLTKTFYHGRTEAMRSATPEAAEFCRVWCSDAPRGEKLHALRKATEEHSRLVAESARGKGVDRHLFALKCIAHRNNIPTPKFFESHPWKTLNHTVLSTSNCGNPALRLFGFGPVVPDGLGIGYVIKDDALSYSVSSKHRQTHRYVHMLRKTLLDLQEQLLIPISFMEVKGSLTNKPSIARQDLRHSLKDVGPILVSAMSNSYDDFYGESGFEDTKAAEESVKEENRIIVDRPHVDKRGSAYFAPVKAKKGVPLLSRIGRHVKLEAIRHIPSGSKHNNHTNGEK